ncbi:MAG: AAA family ATPase [Bauldia sp.]
MGKLSDYRPLEKLVLPGLGELDCSGLVLIVGPNSSGKSQLLRDVYAALSGEAREFTVATDIALRRPASAKWLVDALEEEGYVKQVTDANQDVQLRPTTTYVGINSAIPQISRRNADELYAAFSSAGSRRVPNAFAFHFIRMLVSPLFLDRRLNSLSDSNLIDFVNQPPQSDFHALHMNDRAKEYLESEIKASFGTPIWLDASNGARLTILVSDGAESPEPRDRLSPSKMATFRSIEREGDGLRSYVAICIAVLLGRRPVSLIDEPEMCLHPPQAYRLGQFIGRHTESDSNVTLVATHSSHVLRGILQSSDNMKIVRLTRKNKKFSASIVQTSALREALAKPSVRAESVLDGVFAQGVVIVEADTDRVVYQTALESIPGQGQIDLHFTSVGGKGGIASAAGFYRRLGIPFAILADLDVIADLGELKRILEAAGRTDSAASLLELASSVAERIKEMSPKVDETAFGIRLNSIAAMPRVWSNGDDFAIRRELRELSADLNQMRRLKRGGVRELPPDIATEVGQLLDRLREVGVFLVPVGELEEWVLGRHIGITRDKGAWANEAALALKQGKAEAGEILDFVKLVATYLRERVFA